MSQLARLIYAHVGTNDEWEFVDPSDLMVGDTGQNIGKPGLRINAVHLRGFDQGVGYGHCFAAAFIYSLIVTAKLNDIDPQAWLADALRHLPDTPMSKVHELLPWNWKDVMAQKAV